MVVSIMGNYRRTVFLYHKKPQVFYSPLEGESMKQGVAAVESVGGWEVVTTN